MDEIEDGFHYTTKQLEGFSLASTLKEYMAYGGSRSGKTFKNVAIVIMRASKCKSRHAILRKHFNHAKRSIWLDTLPKVMAIAFPDLPYKSNNSDYYITLPNGSEIWIGGLDNKEKAEKILGNEYSTMYFNECSQLDWLSVQLAKTRLAEKTILTPRFLYDMNPPPKSHWSFWYFEKKLDPIEREPLKRPHTIGSILMNPMDNADNIADDYLEVLEGLPEKERARFLEGLYTDVNDGVVYYEFNAERHVRELGHKLMGTTWIGMDFNVNPMTCVIAKVYNNCLYVEDEIFLENSDTPKMIHELHKRGHTGGTVIPDSTGRNRKTSGKSDFILLKEAGFKIPPVHNPFVTDRVNNVNTRFKEDRILLSPKCKKLRGDLESVAWKNNSLDQKTDPMLTHISDALGYLVYKLFPITYNSPSKITITRQ
jgi:PBSX family phage terminase large subunit